jgi:hypothetical protein
MKISCRITYESGEKAEVNANRPLYLLAMERELKVSAPRGTEDLLWLCWHGLGRPGENFDAWVETIDDFDVDTDEVEKAGKATAKSPPRSRTSRR